MLVVKLAVLVAVAPVVTLMGPVAAPVGAFTVIWVLELTVKPGADSPLKRTDVVPVKLVPVMTTLVPDVPLVGVKLVMVGGGTVKLVALVAVPVGVVTVMGPEVAPVGTLTVICVPAAFTLGLGALVPLKRTAVVPVKLAPVMTTLVPFTPLVGEKLLMTGTRTVKLAVLVPVPLGVTTVSGPVVAPVGTFTVIRVPAAFAT